MDNTKIEPIALSVGSYDSDRWSPQKQHDLFDKIKSMNSKVYDELLKRAKIMNGHSLDMISIPTKMTWQEVIDTEDGYIINTIINRKELSALYLNDQGFINWIMKTPKSGTKFMEELKKEYN